jgi:hypothetical protein
MNGRLTNRNSHSEIFRWLPIGRCDAGHGSGQRKRPGVMRAIKGNIGAETAEKWNSFEKVVVKQKDNARTSPDRLNAEAVGFFAAEAQIKRRC